MLICNQSRWEYLHHGSWQTVLQFPPRELVACNQWHTGKGEGRVSNSSTDHRKIPCCRWAFLGFGAGGFTGENPQEQHLGTGKEAVLASPGRNWPVMQLRHRLGGPGGERYDNSKVTPVSNGVRRAKLYTLHRLSSECWLLRELLRPASCFLLRGRGQVPEDH